MIDFVIKKRGEKVINNGLCDHDLMTKTYTERKITGQEIVKLDLPKKSTRKLKNNIKC